MLELFKGENVVLVEQVYEKLGDVFSPILEKVVIQYREQSQRHTNVHVFIIYIRENLFPCMTLLAPDPFLIF